MLTKSFKLSLLFLILLLPFRTAGAVGLADYADTYKINLEEQKLPLLSELEKSFNRENTLYDTHYTSVFDLGDEFDRGFYDVLAPYGISEKRLKWDNEDLLLAVIRSLPPETYPYIGPMLFTVPNMSEKILNLPGIKETKNQFPERIAPQLRDIEDLEFLSPGLYFLLMPEIWPKNAQKIEYPQSVRMHPKVVYDENFYAALKKLVRPEKFMADGTYEEPLRSQMRTIFPDADTLLTLKDIEAFSRTLGPVQDWVLRRDNRYLFSRLLSLWETYDQQNPNNKVPVPGLKDMVNPCARLVQKATILGKELELAKLVSGEGFTLNEWAYTCDKTIKAYRLSVIPSYMVQAIKGYKRGTHDNLIQKLSPEMQKMRYATMQAIIEMYNAPLNDVAEVRKARKLLAPQWQKYDFKVFGTPLSLL